MLLIFAIFQLFYTSDFFSQLLVIFLIISGLFVCMLSLYAIIKLYYKKNQVLMCLENIKKGECIEKNYFSSIFLYSIQKKQSEEVLYHMSYVYINKELKIKLFLGIATVTGPLIGLLGTIWGIMYVFLSIQKSFDIKIIAPGIAGALITTLAGLFVAIPAAILYHIIFFLIKSYMDDIEICYVYYKESFLKDEEKK